MALGNLRMMGSGAISPFKNPSTLNIKTNPITSPKPGGISSFASTPAFKPPGYTGSPALGGTTIPKPTGLSSFSSMQNPFAPKPKSAPTPIDIPKPTGIVGLNDPGSDAYSDWIAEHPGQTPGAPQAVTPQPAITMNTDPKPTGVTYDAPKPQTVNYAPTPPETGVKTDYTNPDNMVYETPTASHYTGQGAAMTAAEQAAEKDRIQQARRGQSQQGAMITADQNHTSPLDSSPSAPVSDPNGINSLLTKNYTDLLNGKNPAMDQAQRIALNALGGQEKSATANAAAKAARMGLAPGTPGYEQIMDEARRGVASGGSSLLSGLAQKGLDSQTTNMNGANIFQHGIDSLAQQGSQFDKNFNENKRQFNTTSGQRKNEFDTNMAENIRQFDTTSGQRKNEFDANAAENIRQFNVNSGQTATRDQVTSAQHILDNPDLYTPDEVAIAKGIIAKSGLGVDTGAGSDWKNAHPADSDAEASVKSIMETLRRYPENVNKTDAELRTLAQERFKTMSESEWNAFLESGKTDLPGANNGTTGGQNDGVTPLPNNPLPKDRLASFNSVIDSRGIFANDTEKNHFKSDLATALDYGKNLKPDEVGRVPDNGLTQALLSEADARLHEKGVSNAVIQKHFDRQNIGTWADESHNAWESSQTGMDYAIYAHLLKSGMSDPDAKRALGLLLGDARAASAFRLEDPNVGGFDQISADMNKIF